MDANKVQVPLGEWSLAGEKWQAKNSSMDVLFVHTVDGRNPALFI